MISGDELILRLWDLRHDTVEIANHIGVRESEIYNRLTHLRFSRTTARVLSDSGASPPTPST